MAEVRTYSTEMQVEAGASATCDLEVDGLYSPPEAGRYYGPIEDRSPPEPPQYRIFGARARNLSDCPVVDAGGAVVRRQQVAGAWVVLPITLFTPHQIQCLETAAAEIFAEGDAPMNRDVAIN